MSTINIKIPNKIDWYISDNSEFQGIITEVIYDYFEKKQDEETRLKLENNDYFKQLNNSLNKELCK